MAKSRDKYLIRKKSSVNLDAETGEITSETMMETYVAKSPGAFMRLFLNGISAFLPLTNAEKNVLIIAASHADPKDNMVDFSFRVNTEIKKRTGMHDVTRRAAISSLVKKGFLQSVRRGTYIIDPGILFRGSDKDMIKMLSLNIKFRVGLDGLSEMDVAQIFGSNDLSGNIEPRTRKKRESK